MIALLVIFPLWTLAAAPEASTVGVSYDQASLMPVSTAIHVLQTHPGRGEDTNDSLSNLTQSYYDVADVSSRKARDNRNAQFLREVIAQQLQSDRPRMRCFTLKCNQTRAASTIVINTWETQRPRPSAASSWSDKAERFVTAMNVLRIRLEEQMKRPGDGEDLTARETGVGANQGVSAPAGESHTALFSSEERRSRVTNGLRVRAKELLGLTHVYEGTASSLLSREHIIRSSDSSQHNRTMAAKGLNGSSGNQSMRSSIQDAAHNEASRTMHLFALNESSTTTSLPSRIAFENSSNDNMTSADPRAIDAVLQRVADHAAALRQIWHGSLSWLAS